MTLLEVRLGWVWSSGQGKARPIEELFHHYQLTRQTDGGPPDQRAQEVINPPTAGAVQDKNIT